MLQYLIILLDDTSVSYCHYENHRKDQQLISLDCLKAGILFGMKENLMIQFVYPDYELPETYKQVIETIDHSKIMYARCSEGADVVVFNNWAEIESYAFDLNTSYVLRTDKKFLFAHKDSLVDVLPKVSRINIVLTDIETFTEEDFTSYENLLSDWKKIVRKCYEEGKNPQLNILTDRMMLGKMNNCNAGWENITLAPDGKFYVCPAFYLDEKEFAIGDLKDGINVKNSQLYRLAYAPLCRKCDAYHCRRCVYLNKKTTLEINTPSHEQCVVAHLERNASRELLLSIREMGVFLPDKEIKEITYLDPFDIHEK